MHFRKIKNKEKYEIHKWEQKESTRVRVLKIHFAAKRILLCNPNTQIYNRQCAKVQTKSVFHAKGEAHVCKYQTNRYKKGK